MRPKRQTAGTCHRTNRIGSVPLIKPHDATLGVAARLWRARINQAIFSSIIFKLTHRRRLTLRTKKEQCSSYVPVLREAGMLKTFVEEAAALASLTLFVGMIAVWAQLIPQL